MGIPKHEVICGIYKIISPTGKIYIGQSTDIMKRWTKQYQRPADKLHCKEQHKLYNSLLKYGWAAHKFEILEVCAKEQLNLREKNYITLYNSRDGEVGMNCTLGGDGSLGLKWSEESKERASKSALRKFANGYVNPFKGVPLSEERKKAIGKRSSLNVGEKNSFYGRTHTDETKKIIGKKSIGRQKPVDFLERMKVRMSGERNPMYGISLNGEKNGMFGRNHKIESVQAMSKILLNTNTGIFYFGLKEAASSIGIKDNTLAQRFQRGANKPFIYV